MIARVIPFFKAHDPFMLNNYRPISILPIISKIFERLVYKRITKFLNKFKICNNYQFGFRENHSTDSALAFLNYNITQAFDKKQITLGRFLDLSKAFDRVNFQILLDKLHYYGIQGTPLLWIKNYLNDRRQFVFYKKIPFRKIENHHRRTTRFNISPAFIFNIYINDLQTVTKYLQPIMYADDSSFVISGQDIDTLVSQANSELEVIMVQCQKTLTSRKLK